MLGEGNCSRSIAWNLKDVYSLCLNIKNGITPHSSLARKSNTKSFSLVLNNPWHLCIQSDDSICCHDKKGWYVLIYVFTRVVYSNLRLYTSRLQQIYGDGVFVSRVDEIFSVLHEFFTGTLLSASLMKYAACYIRVLPLYLA